MRFAGLVFTLLWIPVDATLQELETVVVTASRRAELSNSLPASVNVIDEDVLNRVNHRHAGEVLGRSPGVWVSRGSGQEHLTSIRSPVLTGAGACGAFLVLEDGIPIRPAGFCNVNQLFEVHTEGARGIEVWRGPGPTLYGSNGLHGLINVLPFRGEGTVRTVALDLSEDDFYRGRVRLTAEGDGFQGGLAATLARDGGFRDNAGYDQTKLNGFLSFPWLGGELTLGLASTYLNQDTAGFIRGEDAYQDEALSQSNPNPEAYRDAYATRLYGVYSAPLKNGTLDVRPFVRHSEMEFLQHFLPGQPVEENGQTSVGVSTLVHFDGEARQITLGLDIEAVDGFLTEIQASPITFGSAFLQETRPAGLHYDYDVTALSSALHGGLRQTLSFGLSLEAGLRLDWIRYDYDNNGLPGNTRDDGTPCGFGGCLFNRPADRDDDFFNVAPRISLSRSIGDNSTAYVALGRGFRAPQATELYRLQRQQSVADLDSEELDSVEVGFKTTADRYALRVSVYTARKRNFIFRDSDGFNVSDGRTSHRGIETEAHLRLNDRLTAQLALSHARHEYRFDQASAGIVSGNDVDTAPRNQGEFTLAYGTGGGWFWSLRWIHQGSYYLEPANERRYPGHDLLDARVGHDGRSWRVQLALDNLLDRRAADRADFAFGSYRYFPDPGRRVGLNIAYSW